MDADYVYWSRIKSLGPFDRALSRTSRDYYLDLVARYKPRSFLDLGCGFATTFRLFDRNGIELHYVGMDITPRFIEVCRRRHPTTDFVIGKLQEIPHPDGSFEMASCRCVLEHLPDPTPAIREMARVSSDTVVIVWFKWPGEKERYRFNSIRGYWENKYTRDKIINTARSCGLRLEDEITEQNHLVWVMKK